jgi:hypothetical protein
LPGILALLVSAGLAPVRAVANCGLGSIAGAHRRNAINKGQRCLREVN